jgi:type IV secretion system protein VirD4
MDGRERRHTVSRADVGAQANRAFAQGACDEAGNLMRVQRAAPRAALRLLLALGVLAVLGALVSGAAAWLWTQAACLLELRSPISLSRSDAASAMWRVLMHGMWVSPARGFPAASERASAPGVGGYAAAAVLASLTSGRVALGVHRSARGMRAGSPLGKGRRTLARHALERGWVRSRTWALPSDMRRLWVSGPSSGRPYLGYIGRLPTRMLAAEVEVQPMVVAPPRTGKSSGYVVPWLLEHDGPALVTSTKLDTYEATVKHREALGQVWVYDPFGESASAGFSPLVPALSWPGALRAGEALASAAHPDQANAANEFWDKEAASMLAPLLHAGALAAVGMDELIRWLDARNFEDAVCILEAAGASSAAEQLLGVGRRDERNRETTVMSALNLLRAYRYPQVVACARSDLTPERFLDGAPNTLYIVAAEHDQEKLRPVILALICAIYEAAIVKARRYGALDPRLLMALDEIANIAPIRNVGSWLSQCGDHGVTISTIWQSLAQIDNRYGRSARDAICAASTAQVFLPPLADPTTTGYLSELLGEETVAYAGGSTCVSRLSLSVAREKAAPAPVLREIERGQAILIYRDLLPAVLRAPRWFEQERLGARFPA